MHLGHSSKDCKIAYNLTIQFLLSMRNACVTSIKYILQENARASQRHATSLAPNFRGHFLKSTVLCFIRKCRIYPDGAHMRINVRALKIKLCFFFSKNVPFAVLMFCFQVIGFLESFE